MKRSDINVLVCCEESQRVCLSFRNLGFNAFSCDLQKCSGGFPEFHFQRDCFEILKSPGTSGTLLTSAGTLVNISKWHLVIAHPPCTYLSKAGAFCLTQSRCKDDRIAQGFVAKTFFMKFLYLDVPHICVENPVPQRKFCLPPFTQIIQPFYFGDNFTKATCLWLKGLPILFAESLYFDSESWCKIHRSPKIRSKTFPGIANAMANQWGNFLISKYNLE